MAKTKKSSVGPKPASVAGANKNTTVAPAGSPAKKAAPQTPSGPAQTPSGKTKPKASELPAEPSRPTATDKNYWDKKAENLDDYTPGAQRQILAKQAAATAKYEEGVTNYFQFVGERNAAIDQLKLKIKEFEAEMKSAKASHANR